MFGDLAQAMAMGLRGKRLGEDRQYERDQGILANQAGQAEREDQRRWREAQAQRQAKQDAREDALSPLEAELLRARIANEQAPRPTPAVSWREREDASGRLIQVNPQTGEVRPLSMDGRPVQGRAPARPVDNTPKPRSLNEVQDLAGDYVARFAATADPVERARLAYRQAWVDGHQPKMGENHNTAWTAFLAASQRQAGATRPPAANDTRGALAEYLARAGGGAPPAPAPTGQPRGIPPLRPGTSQADRWEELVAAGVGEEEATAIVRREIPDE